MKLRLTTGIIGLLAYLQIYSQGGSPSISSINLGRSTITPTTFNLGEIMSTKVDFTVNNDPHIKGSPFYNELFSPSLIVLKNGIIYNGVETRINLVTNDIYFLTKDSTQLVAGKGVIKKVIFYQYKNSKPDSIIFSSGYPAVNQYDENTFYEELVSGEAAFLKFTTKVLNNDQSLTASPLDRRYTDITDYYVSFRKKGTIEKWRKGKDFIIGFLSDKSGAIQKFIDNNNLKCKSPEDVKRVVEYYNHL